MKNFRFHACDQKLLFVSFYVKSYLAPEEALDEELERLLVLNRLLDRFLSGSLVWPLDFLALLTELGSTSLFWSLGVLERGGMERDLDEELERVLDLILNWLLDRVL